MYNIKNLEKFSDIQTLAPEGFAGFVKFDSEAFTPGQIPLKYKELMAIAVALTTQCPYCIEIHSERARAAGVIEAEIAETILVAAAIRAGGAMTHGTHALLGAKKTKELNGQNGNVGRDSVSEANGQHA